MLLRDLGEGELIERIRNRFQDSGVTLGIGDDAAIVECPPGQSIVYCSDLVVEGTHFLRELHPADSVGYKAVAVNASDVGAMGGMPMHFVISLAAPAHLDLSWIDQFYDGIARACLDFTVSLVGGDSSSAALIFADVSMIGQVARGKAVLRSGAQPGDGIYVTGTLGGSTLGLDMLRQGKRDHASVQRHLYPEPRFRVGCAVRDRAHAMIDISDGLSTDLGHIIADSRVSARINLERIPRTEGASETQMLHGGEEYELLITAAELPATIEGIPVTRIGEIVASGAAHEVVLVSGSSERVLQPAGWQHFSAP